MEQYDYVPFEDSSKHIRLLELLPSRCPNMPIESIIRHYPINRCPPFVALSYEWGPCRNETYITIDLKRHKVRENLFWALRALREHFRKSGATKIPKKRKRGRRKNVKGESQTPLVWIDAICIHQEDLLERGQQVKMMSRIYRQATMVHVWLGRGNSLCYDAIDYLANLPRKLVGWSFPSEATYKALESLLSLGYWKRMWIVQEIMNARDLQFLCGDLWFQWEPVSNFISHVAHIELLDTPGAKIILDKLEWMKNPFGQPLLSLVQRYHGQRCSDPRDKVYALLGLVHPNDDSRKLLISPDYALSVDELYKVIMMYCHATYRNYKKSIAQFEAIFNGALRRPRRYLAPGETLAYYEKAVELKQKQQKSQKPYKLMQFCISGTSF
jgi:hypothetical protein